VLNLTHALKLVSIGAGAQLIVQAIIGTAQVLQQHSLGLQDFQELTLDPKWRGVSIVWSRVGTSLRAYGLSDHPNILGGCLALALILLILVYLRVKGRIQILLTGLILLGCTALFLTFSRSAWLGFAAGISLIIIMLILQKKKDQLKDIVLLGIVGLITQAPILWQNATYLGVRLGGSQSFTTPTPENQALDERVLLNQLAYSIFQLHPLSGVGVSAFPTALSQFQPNYPFDLQPPHLVILDVAAETGIFGGVTYLILMIAPWVIILRNLRRFPPSFDFSNFLV
jgi:O-antigen ligase